MEVISVIEYVVIYHPPPPHTHTHTHTRSLARAHAVTFPPPPPPRTPPPPAPWRRNQLKPHCHFQTNVLPCCMSLVVNTTFCTNYQSKLCKFCNRLVSNTQVPFIVQFLRWILLCGHVHFLFLLEHLSRHLELMVSIPD